MKLKVTVNQTEYEIDVEVEQEERPQLSPIVIGVNGGSNPIPTSAAPGRPKPPWTAGSGGQCSASNSSPDGPRR